MKYYIIAGEASGDLHGSNLVKAIKELDAAADIRAWGGDLMQQAGADVRKHYRDLAFMGFVEVVKNLRTILRNMAFCKRDILEFQPNVLVLVDYPGFNLRIAKWAKPLGINTVYYISPQIWAWHTSRVHGIKKTVGRMLCILPFEKDFYKKYDYDVDFVGHPLIDVIDNHAVDSDFRQKNGLSNKPIIALMPGSRRQEIELILKPMLTVVPYFPQFQFVIAAAASQPLAFLQKIVGNTVLKDSFGEGVKIVQNQTYDVMKNATAALVKSGTSTLETALLGVPQVVCYRGSAISFAIAKRVVQVKYISLVNLIADKPIVKELIQDELNTQNLVVELQKAIDSQQFIKNEYTILRGMLGNAGASRRAAEIVVRRATKG
jgi:lipid-A-disaccharide synthase